MPLLIESIVTWESPRTCSFLTLRCKAHARPLRRPLASPSLTVPRERCPASAPISEESKEIEKPQPAHKRSGKADPSNESLATPGIGRGGELRPIELEALGGLGGGPR